MGDMTEDPMKIIVHNPMFLDNQRKKVGEIAGIEIWSDPNIPDDELRVVQGNVVVQRVSLL